MKNILLLLKFPIGGGFHGFYLWSKNVGVTNPWTERAWRRDPESKNELAKKKRENKKKDVYDANSKDKELLVNGRLRIRRGGYTLKCLSPAVETEAAES
jgi:hypothetical protein